MVRIWNRVEKHRGDKAASLVRLHRRAADLKSLAVAIAGPTEHSKAALVQARVDAREIMNEAPKCGYGLAGDLADCLCRYIDRAMSEDELSVAQAQMIVLVIDAIRFMFEHRIAGDGRPVDRHVLRAFRLGVEQFSDLARLSLADEAIRPVAQRVALDLSWLKGQERIAAR